ncbi:hypothetical protein [Endozoicomonas ascidiicola]|uniref:hypothetical protein n=1 Tax=Endozoicomonas ascidiicola TaxID=1698521 RepID=UPI000AF597B2|nr:hypothetical protein [Endozoicomonas ascidiicola]
MNTQLFEQILLQLTETFRRLCGQQQEESRLYCPVKVEARHPAERERRIRR